MVEQERDLAGSDGPESAPGQGVRPSDEGEGTGEAGDAPAVSVEGVRKVYKSSRGRRGGERTENVALDGLSLSVGRGSWTVLLGPNGSGKSTLMRLISTLEHPDAGRVRVLGIDVEDDASAVRARLGMVFQNAALDGLLTVRENLRCAAAMVGVTGAEARSRIDALLGEVGLADRAGERVGRLSGGLARRADLARSLIGGPRVLLLDEPTTGLDLESRRAFLDAIERRVDGEEELTVLMSTHLMDEAERAGHVVMMAHGRVIAEGDAGALRESMGERVLHAPDSAARGVVEEAGLEVSRVDGDVVCRGAEAAMERAVVELTRRGVSFSVGSPTLGDVYLSKTGERL